MVRIRIRDLVVMAMVRVRDRMDYFNEIKDRSSNICVFVCVCLYASLTT